MRITSINFTSNFLFISLIKFIELKDTNGGAIYISSNNKYLNCEFSIFLNCSVTNSGGAIYFSSSSGSFILNKCCGKGCYAYLHSFCLSTLLSSTNNLNSANFTSNSYCSYDFIQRFNVLSLFYGLINCFNYNASMNYIGNHISGPSLCWGNIIFLKFSTIFKCKSDMAIGHQSTIISEFQFVNLVNNSKSNGNYGLIHINQGTLNLKNFIFLGNYMSLFDVYIGTINLYDCIMDHYQFGRGAPNIGTCTTNKETNTFILQHYFCNIDFTFELKNINILKLIFFYNLLF